MLDVSFTVENLDEVVAGLQRLPEVIGSETEQVIDRALALAQGRLAVYPPQPAGSRYRRTGLLGQMWSGATHRIRRVSAAAGGRMYVEGEIRNARPGIGYVQHEPDQATVHRGRWRTAQEVLEELQPELDRLLEAAGERMMRTVAR